MKKEYIQPAMRVVNIQQHKMICSSPYDDMTSPVQTYDDPEDIIDNTDDIW